MLSNPTPSEPRLSPAATFEEEEEGIVIASDVVKVKGGDLDTPDYLRRDRASLRKDVGDFHL